MFHFSNFPPPQASACQFIHQQLFSFSQISRNLFPLLPLSISKGWQLWQECCRQKPPAFVNPTPFNCWTLALFCSRLFRPWKACRRKWKSFYATRKWTFLFGCFLSDMATGRCTCYMLLLFNPIHLDLQPYLFAWETSSFWRPTIKNTPGFCWSRRWSCFNKYLLVVGCFFHKSPTAAVATHLWNLRVPNVLSSWIAVGPEPKKCHLQLAVYFIFTKKRHRHGMQPYCSA